MAPKRKLDSIANVGARPKRRTGLDLFRKKFINDNKDKYESDFVRLGHQAMVDAECEHPMHGTSCKMGPYYKEVVICLLPITAMCFSLIKNYFLFCNFLQVVICCVIITLYVLSKEDIGFLYN